jgi:hypothetical protein
MLDRQTLNHCGSTENRDAITTVFLNDLVNPYNGYGLLMSERPIFIKWLQHNGLMIYGVAMKRAA